MARRHLVWDWNGTLLDDLSLIVEATNHTLAGAGGPWVDAATHRRRFRRPVVAYYADLLGRPVDEDEFARLDRAFHDAYETALPRCALASDAVDALAAWPATQSLLSMWHHADLVPTVARYGLARHFTRIEGRHAAGPADHKAPYLRRHLAAQRVDPERTVVVGDSVDDADAARAAGAGCVLYGGGLTDPEVLRATGAPVAETLREAVDLARSL